MFGRRERDELQRRLDDALEELAHADELRQRYAAAAGELERRRASPLDAAVGKGIVAHVADRRSVAGVLTGVYEEEITLEAARLLQEGAGAIPQDGTIAVPRKQIGWYQLDVTIDDSRLPA